MLERAVTTTKGARTLARGGACLAATAVDPADAAFGRGRGGDDRTEDARLAADRLDPAALESIVNLATALIALIVVRSATLPADEQHMYGHEKAEYFSAGVDGGLIMVAAASIAWVAIRRLLHPVPLEDVSVGLAVSAALGAAPDRRRRAADPQQRV